MKAKRAWKTRPISPTCEKIVGYRAGAAGDDRYTFCDCATSFAYPAAGGGWMALCYRHGLKHQPHVSTIEDLIEGGERFG